MITVTMEELKRRFSQIIQQGESGEEIVLIKGGVAVARIVPVQTPPERKFAIYKGKFRVTPEFSTRSRKMNCSPGTVPSHRNPPPAASTPIPAE